jgi:hypothetical protein
MNRFISYVVLAAFSLFFTSFSLAQNTNSQVKLSPDLALDRIIKQAKMADTKAALEQFKVTASEKEKIRFLEGKSKITITKPEISKKNTGDQALNVLSSAPKCKPRYGCKFISNCKAKKWWSEDVNDCVLEITDCPDQPWCD